MSMMAAGHPGQSPHHGPNDGPPHPGSQQQQQQQQHHQQMMGMMQQQQQHMGNMQQHQMQQHQQHFSPPGNGGGGGGANKCCAGCGAKIMDRFLLSALERYWHNGCLKCSCCQVTLADIGNSCYTKGGMILCKSDYTRMFGGNATCSGCGQMIMSSEYVMRSQSNIYHVKCFACVKCHNQLMTGDRYNLVNGSLLCEQDCLKMLKGTVAPATGVGGRKTKMRVNSAIKA